MISDKAKNSAETLTISYDRNEIVSFDQKLIFGNSFNYDIDNKSNLFGGFGPSKPEVCRRYIRDISEVYPGSSGGSSLGALGELPGLSAKRKREEEKNRRREEHIKIY